MIAHPTPTGVDEAPRSARRGRAGLFSAPRLTTTFVPRPALTDPIVEKLREAREKGVPTALDGQPGFGKSTLAEWVCSNAAVRQDFPDGVIWITLGLGRSQGDVVGLLGQLCSHLAHERVSFHDLGEAGDRLGKLLEDRRILMVLEDVGSRREVEPFLQGGPECVRLVTSPNGIIPESAVRVSVTAMTDQESLSLLSSGLSTYDQRRRLQDLAERSGHWPLLLRLLNGAVRQRVEGGARLREAVDWVACTLNEKGVALDVDSTDDERNAAVSAVVDVALSTVEHTYGESAVDRYGDLAIFPEDIDIPLSLLEQLWRERAGWSASETRLFCRALLSVALLRFNADRSAVHLHPLVRDELRHRFRSWLPDLNRALLDGYRGSPDRGPDCWLGLPLAESYLWSNLGYHLIEAGLHDELLDTVTDLRFVAAKTFAFGPAAVESDLLAALNVAPRNSGLIALQTTMHSSAHLLTGLRRTTDLSSTLGAQLVNVAVLKDSIGRLRAALEPPYLFTRWARLLGTEPNVLRVQTPHQGCVTGVVFDARDRVISSGEDGLIHVWKPETGQGVAVLPGHEGPVNAIAYERAVESVASAGADATIRLWNSRSGEALRLLRGHDGPVNAITFAGSWSMLLSGGSDGTLRLWEWDVGAEKLLMRAHEGGVTAVAFLRSPYYGKSSDQAVSAGVDRRLRLWNLTTGDAVTLSDGEGGAVCTLAADDAGRRVAAGSEDGTIRLWDMAPKPRVTRLVRHGSRVRSLAFDQAGSLLISGGEDGMVRLWDAEVGDLLGVFEGRGSWIYSLAFDARGARVAAAGADGTTRIIRLSPEAGDGKRSLFSATSVVFDTQGSRAFCGGDDGVVRAMDAESGVEVFSSSGHEGPIHNLAVDPTGKRLVSCAADGSIRVWDARSGAALRTLRPEVRETRSLAFKSATRFVSGGSDGAVRLWDAATGRLLGVLLGHDGPVTAVAVSLDGRRVVSGGRDQSVRIWDIAKLRAVAVMTGHQDGVTDVDFDPTGATVVSGSRDGTVRLWHWPSQTEQTRVDSRPLAITSLAVGKDGRHVAYASEDGKIRIWRMEQRTIEAELQLDGPVWACGWGPRQDLLIGSSRGVYCAEVTPNGE